MFHILASFSSSGLSASFCLLPSFPSTFDPLHILYQCQLMTAKGTRLAKIISVLWNQEYEFPSPFHSFVSKKVKPKLVHSNPLSMGSDVYRAVLCPRYKQTAGSLVLACKKPLLQQKKANVPTTKSNARENHRGKSN